MDNKLIYFEVTLHTLITIVCFALLIVIYVVFYIIYSRYTLKKTKKISADLKKELETAKSSIKDLEPFYGYEKQNIQLRKNNKDLKFKNELLLKEAKKMEQKVSKFSARLYELQSKLETNDDKDAIAFAKMIEKELKP